MSIDQHSIGLHNLEIPFVNKVARVLVQVAVQAHHLTQGRGECGVGEDEGRG